MANSSALLVVCGLWYCLILLSLFANSESATSILSECDNCDTIDEDLNAVKKKANKFYFIIADRLEEDLVVRDIKNRAAIGKLQPENVYCNSLSNIPDTQTLDSFLTQNKETKFIIIDAVEKAKNKKDADIFSFMLSRSDSMPHSINHAIVYILYEVEASEPLKNELQDWQEYLKQRFEKLGYGNFDAVNGRLNYRIIKEKSQKSSVSEMNNGDICKILKGGSSKKTSSCYEGERPSADKDPSDFGFQVPFVKCNQSVRVSSDVYVCKNTNSDVNGRCGYGVIRIDPSLVEIEEKAFAGTDFESRGKITGVDFTDCTQLTTIGEGAFKYNKITSLSIPSSVIMIGDGAFHNNI